MRSLSLRRARTGLSKVKALIVRSFEEPVDLGRHDEIVFVQSFDLFRLHHHRDVAPAKADIGVMTFGLGELAHLLNECKRLAEVAKSERSASPFPLTVAQDNFRAGLGRVDGLRKA